LKANVDNRAQIECLLFSTNGKACFVAFRFVVDSSGHRLAATFLTESLLGRPTFCSCMHAYRTDGAEGTGGVSGLEIRLFFLLSQNTFRERLILVF